MKQTPNPTYSSQLQSTPHKSSSLLSKSQNLRHSITVRRSGTKNPENYNGRRLISHSQTVSSHDASIQSSDAKTYTPQSNMNYVITDKHHPGYGGGCMDLRGQQYVESLQNENVNKPYSERYNFSKETPPAYGSTDTDTNNYNENEHTETVVMGRNVLQTNNVDYDPAVDEEEEMGPQKVKTGYYQPENHVTTKVNYNNNGNDGSNHFQEREMKSAPMNFNNNNFNNNNNNNEEEEFTEIIGGGGQNLRGYDPVLDEEEEFGGPKERMEMMEEYQQKQREVASFSGGHGHGHSQRPKMPVFPMYMQNDSS